MPRLIRTIENVIVINAGQLPAAAAPYWYSGRGADQPGGSVGGPTAIGINVGGGANLFTLYVTVSAWDAAATGLEVVAEVTRVGGGTSAWGPIPLMADDADGIHSNVKPSIYQIKKADFPTVNVAIPVPVHAVGQQVRFGVRSIGTETGTALTAALELAVDG